MGLKEKEEKYYEKNPIETLKLTPTGSTTKYNMPVYKDQFNKRHSESTITFPVTIGNTKKFITVPSIWPGDSSPEASPKLTGKYWSTNKVRAFVLNNMTPDGKYFKNEISGEKIPFHANRKDALDWALKRDKDLQFELPTEKRKPYMNKNR